eukprot:352312-Chlamydomonas_euryale.AAC.19
MPRCHDAATPLRRDAPRPAGRLVQAFRAQLALQGHPAQGRRARPTRQRRTGRPEHRRPKRARRRL